MSEIDNFKAVRRVAAPEATAHENGGISVRVALNVEPDGHWERFFGEQQGGDDLWRSQKAQVTRRGNAHPGARYTPAIYFRIRTPDELGAETRKIDEFIHGANEHYMEVFIPAEREREEVERQKQAELAATQAELDRVAADLVPPDGEEGPPKKTVKAVQRIPTRSTNSRDW